MGTGYRFVCKKCGFDLAAYLGIGFLSYEADDEVKRSIIDGEFGEEIKSFYQQHSNAEVVSSSELYRCLRCSDLTVRPKIRIITKSGFYEKTYTCDKCKKEVLTLQDPLADNIQCPVCREYLSVDEIIMWD